MATLPDKFALRGREPRAVRGIPDYPNSSPVAAALTGLGRAVAGVGQDVAQIATAEQAEVERAQKFDAAVRLVKFEDDVRQWQQQQFETTDKATIPKLPGTVDQGFKKFADEFANTVPPHLRQEYDLKLARMHSAVNENTIEFQRKQSQAFEGLAVDESLDRLRNRAVNSRTPSMADIAQQDALIDTSSAFPTAAAKEVAKAKARELYAETAIRAMPPQERARVVSAGQLPPDIDAVVRNAAAKYGIDQESFSRMAQIESEGNPRAFNEGSKASGLFQFIPKTAKQYGLTDPFNAAANADAAGRLWRDNREVLVRELGREPTSGELYLAHQQGAAGAAKLLRDPSARARDVVPISHVQSNLPDSQKGRAASMTAGEFASLWTSRFAGRDDERVAQYLKPETRLTIKDQAEREWRQTSREVLTPRVANAVAEITQTGATSDLPSRADFDAAYEPLQADREWMEFQGRMASGQVMNGLRTLTPAGVEAAVAQQVPRVGAADYAEQLGRYDIVRRAAAQNLAERVADPFVYTAKVDPQVAEAWNVAKTPEQVAGAMSATEAAQAKLGFRPEQRVLLPETMAKEAVAAWKRTDADQPARMQGPAKAIFASSKPEHQAAVFNQLVSAGLPPESAAVFRAMARGDDGAADRLARAALVDPGKMPTKSEQRKVDIDAQIIADIFAPGTLGDAMYGTAAGVSSNDAKAAADFQLVKKAVLLEMSTNGDNAALATAKVSKDLFGEARLHTDTDMVLAVPKALEPETVAAGLRAQDGKLRDALRETLKQAAPVTATDAVTARYQQRIADQTVSEIADSVVWRNYGRGYAPIDPATGKFIARPDGAIFTVTPEEAVTAAATAAADGVDPMTIPLGGGL